MKKLITILAIMIVLVGTVFATDTARIKVVTTIDPEEATFKLYATGVTGVTATTATAADVVAASNAYDANGNTVVIANNELIENGATVNFSIKQNTLGSTTSHLGCRTTSGFYFDVEATNLKLDGTNLTYNATNQFFLTQNAASSENSNVAIEILGTANDHVAFNPTTGTSTATTHLKVTFDGQPVAKDTVLATFSCSYAANPIAIPGDYTATITLTVTAAN